MSGDNIKDGIDGMNSVCSGLPDYNKFESQINVRTHRKVKLGTYYFLIEIK